jgi:uncharacterized peroxidase-related enzyme
LHDDALADAIDRDWTAAGLDPRRTAMLDYAAKLTRTPGAMARADVAALRAAGFSDADVLAIAQVVGYFAYVNRIADGLGVQLEPE